MAEPINLFDQRTLGLGEFRDGLPNIGGRRLFLSYGCEIPSQRGVDWRLIIALGFLYRLRRKVAGGRPFLAQSDQDTRADSALDGAAADVDMCGQCQRSGSPRGSAAG